MRGYWKWVTVVVSIAALLSLAACGSRGASTTSGTSAQPVEMIIGHATANDAQDTLAKFFATEVGRLSGGKIKATVHNASQLGSNEKMNKDVRSGAQHVLIQPTGFMAPYVPTLGVLDLPFLFPNDEVQSKVLNSDAAKDLQDQAKAADVEIVGFFGGGFKIMATKFPLTKADDLKGKKFRVIQSPELAGQFKAFGAIGVPMSLPETYTALQQGAVEGVENPEDVIFRMKHHEVAKNLTNTNHGSLSSVIVVSSQWLSKLPADQQKAIREAGKSAANEALKIYKQARADAQAEITKANMKIVDFPAAERAKLKTMGDAIWNEIKADPAKAKVLDALTKATASAK